MSTGCLGHPHVAEGPTGHGHWQLGGHAIEVSWEAGQVLIVTKAGQDQAHKPSLNPLPLPPGSEPLSPCSKADAAPALPSWSTSSSLDDMVPLDDIRSNFLKSPKQEAAVSVTPSQEGAGISLARCCPRALSITLAPW